MNKTDDMNLQTYIIEHQAIHEGGTHKVHISDWDSEKIRTLCGINTEHKGTSSLADVTKKWIDQPDPDLELCKKCKKISLKLLA